MNFTFELASIPIEVEFKTVKTLRLTVYPPDGRVSITAPTGTHRDAIGKFAASRIAWIEKHRERFLSHSRLSPSLQNKSTVYVWGKPYGLKLAEREGNSKIVIDGDCVKMYIRPGAAKTKRTEVLDRWYRRALKEAASPIIKKWESKIGVTVQKLYIRKMKSCWGSCNCQKQTLRLNSELAKRNPECLDYVVLHEMLHIIEKGHNRNFYGLMNQFMPEWKIIRKKMNSGEI